MSASLDLDGMTGRGRGPNGSAISVRGLVTRHGAGVVQFSRTDWPQPPISCERAR